MSSQDDADDTNEDAADCAGNTYFVNVLVGLRGTAQHAINVGEASGKDVESLRESVMELMETEEALLSIRTMCGLDENTDANNLLDEVTLFALAEGARGQPLVRTVFPFVNFSTISQSKGETTYLYARIAPPSTTGGAPSGGNRKKRTSAADQPPPPLGAAAAVTKRKRSVPSEAEFSDRGLLVVHAPLFLDPSSAGTGQFFGVPGHASQKDLIIDFAEISTNKTREAGG
jgi:hypothetical protein